VGIQKTKGGKLGVPSVREKERMGTSQNGEGGGGGRSQPVMNEGKGEHLRLLSKRKH